MKIARPSINESESTEYHLRVVHSGPGAGLDIAVTLNEEDFESRCNGYLMGFKLILTMPGDALKMSEKLYFRIPASEHSRIIIKPKVILTSDGLRNYKPNHRQCFYQSERQLRFYKKYTQTNCEEECLANFTKTECGCVKFSMPSMYLFESLFQNSIC